MRRSTYIDSMIILCLILTMIYIFDLLSYQAEQTATILDDIALELIKLWFHDLTVETMMISIFGFQILIDISLVTVRMRIKY